jgi:hypothetical protein
LIAVNAVINRARLYKFPFYYDITPAANADYIGVVADTEYANVTVSVSSISVFVEVDYAQYKEAA